MSVTAGPHDVQAKIHYYKDAEDGEPATLEGITSLAPKFVDSQEVTIHDVRGFEQDFNLGDNGFQFLKSDWPFEDPLDEETIINRVRPAAEKLVKQ